MELQLFVYQKIALHFYYSKNSVQSGKVNVDNIFIAFPGLPQKINDQFFADKVNKQTAFFSVYYYGSWLSGGDFTYENCKRTVELAIEFVKNKNGIKAFDDKKLRWNYTALHVMGYSFAGNPVISARISKQDVKNVILFAPLLFLYRTECQSYLKEAKKVKAFYDFSLFYLAFLKRGYKFAFRGIERAGWKKYFSGQDPESRVKRASGYPAVTIFHGRLDEKISYTSSMFFQAKKYPGTKVILLDRIGHDLEKLFDPNQIAKLIQIL